MMVESRQKNGLYGAMCVGILVLSSGCGGGGGGSSASANQPQAASTAQQQTPVTASGVITGFSSVFVNDNRYAVETDTVVAIEGEAERLGDDSALRIGMKVRIHAEMDANGERVAQRIEYDEDLKGPVSNVQPQADDPGIGVFEAVGIQVVVDANTVFDDDVGDNNGDGTLDIRDLELPAGEIQVEVSGYPSPAGIIATRIDRVSGPGGLPGTDNDEYELKGFVDSVANDNSALVVSGVTFNIRVGAGGTLFDDGLTMGPELVGVYVEVKADESAGEYIAVRVEREDAIGDRNDDQETNDDDRFGELEIEGFLVAVNTASDPQEILINGTKIQVADASALSNLVGSRVKIEGVFDRNAILTIRQTNIESEQQVRIEDQVAEVSVAAGTISTRLGVLIEPTGTSRVEDDLADSDEGDHLTPAEFVARVQTGDSIKARGASGADGGVSWTRVEREDDDDLACELRGPVTAIEGADASAFSFVVQDVIIDLSGISRESDFGGIGRSNFFAELGIGDIVKAKSDEQGLGCQLGVLTAQEIEFEADDNVFRNLDDNAGAGNDNDPDNEITGTPENVTLTGFQLGEQRISVNDNTLIDDSLIERALGREFDGDDQPLGQVPAGLTLTDLLPGTFAVNATINASGVALRIEDL